MDLVYFSNWSCLDTIGSDIVVMANAVLYAKDDKSESTVSLANLYLLKRVDFSNISIWVNINKKVQ